MCLPPVAGASRARTEHPGRTRHGRRGRTNRLRQREWSIEYGRIDLEDQARHDWWVSVGPRLPVGGPPGDPHRAASCGASNSRLPHEPRPGSVAVPGVRARSRARQPDLCRGAPRRRTRRAGCGVKDLRMRELSSSISEVSTTWLGHRRPSSSTGPGSAVLGRPCRPSRRRVQGEQRIAESGAHRTLRRVT